MLPIFCSQSSSLYSPSNGNQEEEEEEEGGRECLEMMEDEEVMSGTDKEREKEREECFPSQPGDTERKRLL